MFLPHSHLLLRVTDVFFLICIATQGVTAQPTYRVIDIGTLGGAWSRPYWISDGGYVVGESATANVDSHGNVIRHAFIWDGATMTDLDPGSVLGSAALSVNSSGQAVGYFRDGAPYYHTHPVLWLPEPAFGLPAGPNRISTVVCDTGAALGINETGQIVGLLGYDVFIWLPSAAYGLPAGSNLLTNNQWCYSDCTGCAPVGINELGQIAYAQSLWLPAPAYGLSSGWTDLWPPVFDDYHDACDINNAGMIVGYNSTFAFLYVYLNDLPSGKSGIIGQGCGCALNELGEILVGTQLYGKTWSGDINSCISPAFGLHIDCTAGINMHGQIPAWNGLGYGRPALLDPIDFDVNGDGVRDDRDPVAVAACLSGPGSPVPPNCGPSDLDRDGDVDLVDVHLIMWGLGTAP